MIADVTHDCLHAHLRYTFSYKEVAPTLSYITEDVGIHMDTFMKAAVIEKASLLNSSSRVMLYSK